MTFRTSHKSSVPDLLNRPFHPKGAGLFPIGTVVAAEKLATMDHAGPVINAVLSAQIDRAVEDDHLAYGLARHFDVEVWVLIIIIKSSFVNIVNSNQ